MCSLSQRERVGERGYRVGRSAGTPSSLVTPLPPIASRRAPPSPKGEGEPKARLRNLDKPR
ncbi:hypothetical protein [Caulobacter sp. BK020]|uniref:hypothetical protein n=1 Tax=Caulobacter sp. BK020 TaxID=2512117 RepID=UPI001042DF10|nr:hypothetical protein [Caulobacter sp. BK020]